MTSESRAAQTRIAAVLFIALLTASIIPVRSYDYFWHLATGRWMADHGRMPQDDPFAVASDRGSWINGEWLFQLALYGAYRIGGHTGISVLRGVVVATLFILVFLLAGRRAHWSAALLLTVLGWLGADHRLTARPETMATFFVVAAVWQVTSPPSWRKVVLYSVLTAFWINIHPSALLAPVLALVGLLDFRNLRWRSAMVVGSFFALLLNPHGWSGVLAPLRLMRKVGEGTFTNLEWLPSSPQRFPLLYLMIALGIVVFVAGLALRVRSSNEHRLLAGELVSLALFGVLSYLAVRHLRHQGFFFASVPILLATFLPANMSVIRARLLAAGAVAVWMFGLSLHLPWRTGIDEDLFPVQAVEKLRQTGVAGTIYNPDQFGGFLIWSFYPDRRALTDGRNELYSTYLREYEQARTDSRAWTRLLHKYDVRSAVEEHRKAPMEVVNAETGERMRVPAWTVLFPRGEWAMVGYDDVGMAFVRRDAIAPQRLESMEVSGITSGGR